MTPNKEDYLKCLYKLGGTGTLVNNKSIAEALSIAPASVTEMLTKLSREGLIHYEPYKGSMLSARGMEIAVSLLRGHRLWEVFLIRHLGYSWSEAHEDAELLEHITPTRLAARLDRFLNYPAWCPHGSAIPHPDGVVENIALRPLETMQPGEASSIRRVVEEKELLDYLEGLGIHMNAEVRMLSVGDYEGPLTLETEGKTIQLSRKAGSKVFVDA